MKILFYIALFGGLYQLLATSTMSISNKKCFKARYGHTIGGTIHSKRVLHNRLLREQKKLLPHTKEEALSLIQTKYPQLAIDDIEFIIKNCQGYYKSNSYLFDPNTLNKIEREKR